MKADTVESALPRKMWPKKHPVTGEKFRRDKVDVQVQSHMYREYTISGPRHPGYKIPTRWEMAEDWDGDLVKEAVEWRDATDEERAEIDADHKRRVAEWEKEWCGADGGWMRMRESQPPTVTATFWTKSGHYARGEMSMGDPGHWVWCETGWSG